MYNLMTEDKRKLTALGKLWAWAVVLAFIGSMFSVWINRPQPIRITECSLTVDGVTETWISNRSSIARSNIGVNGEPLGRGHTRVVRVTYYYYNNISRVVTADQMFNVSCQPYVADTTSG